MKKFLTIVLALMFVISCASCAVTSEDDVLNSSGNNDSVSEPQGEDEQDSSSDVIDEDTSGSASNDTSDTSEDVSTDTSVDTSEDEPQDDPNKVITKTIENISITFNGYSEFKSNGYRISSGDDKTVSAAVSGAASVVNELTNSSITASVDVTNISETGEIELVITYSAPNEINIVSTSDSLITLIIKKTSSEIVPPEVDDIREVNGVLISGIRAMEKFGGGASAGQTTAENLNKFKEAVGSDVNVYVLPAPLASAFYAPVGYEKSISRHKDCFYGMRDALVNVGFVDTISALSTHVNEDIYFRTDHHWQALAAYYASEEFAKVAGVPFDNISTFKMYSTDGVLGSFYSSYTKDPVLKANPDTMTWYEPTRQHTVTYYSRDYYKNPISDRTLFSTNDGYTKFIYGDSYTTHISTNVGNGRKLLLFKDSYGNALAPFLVGSFDEVIVADYREFLLNAPEFIQEHGITDVCFELAAFTVAGSKRHYIVDLINY